MNIMGTILDFDAGTHTAVILLDGSAGGACSGTPVNRGIAAGDMLTGRRVVVATTGFASSGYVVLAVIA